MIDLFCLLEFYNTYEHDDIYHMIAKKILENFNVVSQMNIQELSEFLFVSNSTIYRFIKIMGYENHNQMRIGQISFLENYYLQGRYVSRGNNITHFKMYTNYLINKISKFNELDMEYKLNKIIDLIMESDEIIFVGMPIPSFIWRLQVELIMLNKKTSAFLNPNYQKGEIVKTNNKSLVIFLQYLADYSSFYIDTAKAAKDNGHTTVLFSSIPLSSVINSSDVSFIIEGEGCENDLFMLEIIFNYIGNAINNKILLDAKNF